MNEWDHLPNAALIDQVLADLRANPKVFTAAWAAARAAARDAQAARLREMCAECEREALGETK